MTSAVTPWDQVRATIEKLPSYERDQLNEAANTGNDPAGEPLIGYLRPKAADLGLAFMCSGKLRPWALLYFRRVIPRG